MGKRKKVWYTVPKTNVRKYYWSNEGKPRDAIAAEVFETRKTYMRDYSKAVKEAYREADRVMGRRSDRYSDGGNNDKYEGTAAVANAVYALGKTVWDLL